MKALITGASGFVGKHLSTLLESKNLDVIKTNRTGDDCIQMDLTNYEQVRSVLRHFKPDYIFHLGAIAFVPASWQDPKLVFEVNAVGTLNLLNAVRSVNIDPVIQIAGSSEEYGMVLPEETPITEANELRPLSPYAVSKVAADLLGYQYFKSYGMKIVRTRAFNHAGYGRGEEYFTSNFAKQIVSIEKGLQAPVINHGNLEAVRDITDVRDIVKAYYTAVVGGEYGEVYNIGSGRAHSIEYYLDHLLKFADMTDVKRVEDPKRMRPSDVPVLLCDASKFRQKTSWEIRYTVTETLYEELKYWRERL